MKITIRAEDIYVGEIQIQERYRRRGIGHKLMQDVIALSEVTEKRLWLCVVKDNPAQGFYEKYGFIPFRETAIYLQMERVPAQPTKQCPVVCRTPLNFRGDRLNVLVDTLRTYPNKI